MKIELRNFTRSGRSMGYVAFFEAKLECGIVLRGLSLCRPEKTPSQGWLIPPNMERECRHATYLPPDLRDQIGRRACMAYGAVAEIDLEYAPPVPKVKPESVAEPDDAGLRRVLCAGERKSLAAAGI